MNKCIGCGIKLQNDNKDLVGYTKKLDNDYCERCFKTIHYNEVKKVEIEDNLEIIKKVNKLKLTTLFITDLISLNEELINIFKSINNRKMLVINKCDIIPNNLKLEHIEKNIKDTYKIKDEICFISAKREYNLNSIINEIENSGSVILCGETSSGKSTLINKLIGSNLTTSKHSNTTLSFIKMKYLDYIIYDTPGIILKEDKKSTEGIKIKTMSLNKDYVLELDNFLIKCDGNMTLFLNNMINIKTKKSSLKLDNVYEINIPSDLVFKEGFITIKNPCTVYTNKKMEIRKSIISK